MINETDVTDYFDADAAARPLRPNDRTLGGWGKQIKYELASTFIHASGGGHVLDLGCNIGHVAAFSAAMPTGAAHITGIDLSLAALRRAGGLGLPAATFAAAGGAALPFAGGSFDCVVCLDVLEHVVAPLAVLREVYRVLRPGGRLLLMLPNPESIGSYGSYRLQRWLRARRGRPVAAKDHFIQRAQLVAWLDTIGFQVDVAPAFLLPRPFLTGRGWVLTPPLPPRPGWYWQQMWRRLLGLHGERLAPAWQARVCHSIQVTAAKETQR